MNEIFAIIELHESFEDWPYPLMYEERYHRYPNVHCAVRSLRSAPYFVASLCRKW